MTSEENWESVRSGISGIRHHGKVFGVGDDFTGALLDRSRIKPAGDGYSFFETLMIRSVEEALSGAGIDASLKSVRFVVSTTKGNSDLIGAVPDSEVMLWRSAGRISSYFGNPNPAVVVSNACISGGCAQYAAMNILEEAGSETEYVVSVGGDILSKFIIAGFQSFRALSQDLCRPFDKERKGLNLGEAAATMIFSRSTSNDKCIVLEGCSLRNDANHISGPSRTGEGLYNAIESAYTMSGIRKEDTSFICAHGTSTVYNDEMESIAFERSGLQGIPVMSLKPHFGHTLGAAGLLETIISVRALKEGLVLPIISYSDKGVSGDILPVSSTGRSGKKVFLKTVSGFAGSNAAMLYREVVCR